NTVYNPLKYYNYLVGHNSRLDEVQAALLRIKLPLLDSYINARRERAAVYNKALQSTSLVLPVEGEGVHHTYYLYMVQSENREAVIKKLSDAGIATGVYYPIPIHLQKCYNNLGYKLGSLPNAEYLSHRTFAIPMFPEMTAEEQAYVIETLQTGE
ncbi:MAG: DegT/DnrJ/EryC1/StrS family aminotransferase, partial [Oscillospiraceae bacterium]|nr:DegT/DnrJ/EryC1/StrS family aminotransferase [Oscillospiraceae bacterium]